MNRWNCLATGPTTQDHIDIIWAGADKKTNWFIGSNWMLLNIAALPVKSVKYKNY